MIKVNYTELDGPYGPAMRLEAAGHARSEEHMSELQSR